MRIAILGGTGKEGKALGRRWATAGHEIFIGSRRREKALGVAAELREKVPGARISGGDNGEAAEHGEVVVLSVPYAGRRPLLEQVRGPVRGKVVVDIAVPLSAGNPPRLAFPAEGSAACETQALLGAGVKVIAALHNVSSHLLGDAGRPIDCDVLVCGDDVEAKGRVMDLVEQLGVKAIDAGPLENAVVLEGLTAVLLGINKRHKVKTAGLRITGLPEGTREG